MVKQRNLNVLDWFGGKESFLKFHSQPIERKGLDEPDWSFSFYRSKPSRFIAIALTHHHFAYPLNVGNQIGIPDLIAVNEIDFLWKFQLVQLNLNM